MLFAIARRLRKTRAVTVGHPCGVGDLTVERIAGFVTKPAATTGEYRRYLQAQFLGNDAVYGATIWPKKK